MTRQTFEQIMAGLDEQERRICRSIGNLKSTLTIAADLPWPLRPFQRWRGRRLLRKGERMLLRIRQIRDDYLENERAVRAALVRRGVWG